MNLDDAYWGGVTENGELLHLAATAKAGWPRSACGLMLTDAWDVPDQMRWAKCKRCLALEAKAGRDEVQEAGLIS